MLAQLRTTQDPLTETLAALPTASPELLRERALLQRVDTKFAFHTAELHSLLASLTDRYALVRVGDAPLDRYETTYFDTPDFTLFHDHLRDRRPRYKVRIRHYLGRELSFLEVKRKSNADSTLKWRRQLAFGESGLSEDSAQFVNEHCPVGAGLLRPMACTNFDRVMLIGLDTPERVTLDFHVDLIAGSREERLQSIVIAEVKQDRQRWRTPVMLSLRAHHVRPLSISKYCTAVALLVDEAGTNRYRARLRELSRVVSRSETRA